MFRTRTRKVLSDVWSRKGRTFLVAAAIFIGVMGTIALFSMNFILVGQLEEDIQEDELAMVQVAVTSDSGAEVSNEDYLKILNGTYRYVSADGHYLTEAEGRTRLEEVGTAGLQPLEPEISGVSIIMGGVEGQEAFWKKSLDDEDFEDGGVSAYTILDDAGNLVEVPVDETPLEPGRQIEGRYPVDGANEVAIEQRMADEHDLAVGDSIYFRILGPSRQAGENFGRTGTVEEWEIVGIYFHPYSLLPEQSMYSSINNANYIAGRTGFRDFWARFNDFETAEGQSDNFNDLIATYTPYTPVFSQVEDPAENQLIQGAEILGSLMSFLALLALLVSGFLVVNVISSIVVEQKRQIGVMKSMGAARQDNFYIYSGIAFTYGLLGVIPGVIAGIPLGNAASHALAPEVNTVLDGFQFAPLAVIIGVAVGLAVPVLASIIPVWTGTRVTIIDAMTDLGIDADYGTGPLARLIKVLPLPITIKQGLSNITIKKSRQLFTIITLAVAVGAFMGIFAVFESFNTGIGLFLDSFNVDVGVFPNERRNPEEIENLLLENFGRESDDHLIESIAPGFQYQIEFEGYDPVPAAGGPPGVLAYGYNVNYRETDQGNPFNFEVSEGEEIRDRNKDDAIMVSSSLSLAMDREVGDTVVMKVPGSSKEFEIVAIIDFPIDQVWLHWETLARMTGYTFDTVRGGSGLTEQIPGEARRFIRYATVAGIDDFGGDLPEEMTGGLSQILPEDAEIPANAVNAYGVTPELLTVLTPAEGFADSQPFSPDGNSIILSSAVASQGPDGGYELGDELTMTSLFGDEQTFTVSGVYDLPAVFGETLPPAWVALGWQALGRFDGADITSLPIPQGYFMITTIDDPSAEDLQEVNDQINEVFSNAGISAFYLNFVQLTEDIAAGFLTIQAVLTAVALLIALVGALGLLTTLSMSVFERQKEIGVMRSIGASSSTIALQFLTEGLVVGFIAWLVGIPLGYLIEVGLLGVTGFDETFPAIISITGIVIGLVGILVISAVASIFPALGAARKTVSNILRYQ